MYFPCHVPSHSWLATPCECALRQAAVHQHPASYAPPNAWAGYGDEAGFSFDDFGQLLVPFPSTSLTVDGGVILPPNQAPSLSRVVPSTTQPLPSYPLSGGEAPASNMDEDLFPMEQDWLLSPLPDVQLFDGPQQSAPVQDLTIDTKELLLMGSPETFSPPMPGTTAIPIPSQFSPGDPSLLMTPLLTPSSYSCPMFAGRSPEVASPHSPFGLQGSPQAPVVDTSSYDEILNQGYPGNSLLARERRDILRRTITNEIAGLPISARDVKKLADTRKATDDIPEDDLPSPGKKTPPSVLQCAWVDCDHVCNRPDRLKTHVYTHIPFKPFPCDRKCGDQHCTARFHSKGDCSSHQTKNEKKKICKNCGEESTSKNWQRHTRSNKCKNNGRRSVSFSM